VDTEQAHEEVSALIEEVPSVPETSTINQQTSETTQKTPAQDTMRTNGPNGMNTAPIPSYTQQQPPQPQKIPTYEQPLPNEYRDTGAARQENAYQNMLVNERSVRPSEMKDEGWGFFL